MQITPDRQLLAAAGIYWAFQKHVNSSSKAAFTNVFFAAVNYYK